MSALTRRTIPLGLTIVTSLLMVVEMFVPTKEIASLAQMARDWVVILSGFALCLGAANLLLIHGKHIASRAPQRWFYSAVLLFVMILFVTVGVVFTPASVYYQTLYNSVNFPLSNVMFALIACYIFSAAVRAFQPKRFETALFMACGLLVIIGNIPAMQVFFPQLAAVGPWIQNVPSLGAVRGIYITAAVAAIIFAIRALLGRQRGYLRR